MAADGAYRPDGRARWVRIEASDGAGHAAWSQTLWIDAAWAFVWVVADNDAGHMRGDIALTIPAGKSPCESSPRTDAVRPNPLALWLKSAEVNRAIGPIFARRYGKDELNVPDALRQARKAVIGVVGPSKVR